MKKLIVVFFFLFSHHVSSDPVEIKNDWAHLFSTLEKFLLMADDSSAIGIMVETNKSEKILYYYASKKDWQNASQNNDKDAELKIEQGEKIIFDFSIRDKQSKNYDVYVLRELIENKSIKVVYVYDQDNKDLHKIYIEKPNTFNLKSEKWNYGNLVAVIQQCDGYNFNYFHIPNIDNKNEDPVRRIAENGDVGIDDFYIYDNSFLTIWDFDTRPDDFKSNYFLTGGRTDIVISDIQPNKVIISNTLEYIGDIISVDQIHNMSEDESRCNLYNKISIRNGKLFLGDLDNY